MEETSPSLADLYKHELKKQKQRSGSGETLRRSVRRAVEPIRRVLKEKMDRRLDLLDVSDSFDIAMEEQLYMARKSLDLE